MGVSATLAASVRLPLAPDSVGSARAAVREVLTDAGLDRLVDTATLLVSELTTNVLLHARTAWEVRVELRGSRLRVSVRDGSPRAATRRPHRLRAGTGRGLGLVETLAAGWGSEPASPPWAKAVWFELDLDASDDGFAEGALYGEDWLALVDDL
jgi:anti-sigma regulatory factor (Ser/Thr protein kinase)